jgi:hypothetical protein
MECQELEGHSCPKQHPDHLRRPNLGQRSRRLHGKAVANSRKVMAVVKEVVVKETVVKEAACSWKELDLKDEMTSMERPTVAQKDWAHGIRIQPGDVLVCVWYVHLCCESVGYSMGTQWLSVETKEYAHYEL